MARETENKVSRGPEWSSNFNETSFVRHSLSSSGCQALHWVLVGQTQNIW